MDSPKLALKKTIGAQVLTPFELHTCLLEVANLFNQRRPIGRIPNDPGDGSYLCPNDILLGRVLSHVTQDPFRETKNPRYQKTTHWFICSEPDRCDSWQSFYRRHRILRLITISSDLHKYRYSSYSEALQITPAGGYQIPNSQAQQIDILLKI